MSQATQAMFPRLNAKTCTAKATQRSLGCSGKVKLRPPTFSSRKLLASLRKLMDKAKLKVKPTRLISQLSMQSIKISF